MNMKMEHVFAGLVLSILGWGSLQLYQMNANMSVIAYKVDENYKMIKPMWQDYLVRTVNLRRVKDDK